MAEAADLDVWAGVADERVTLADLLGGRRARGLGGPESV